MIEIVLFAAAVVFVLSLAAGWIWSERDRNKAVSALQRIAGMETPGANATVKKMAREAREAAGMDLQP